MKERPIIFSGPMVRAILEGGKTQTRRPMKSKTCPYGSIGDRLWVKETFWECTDNNDVPRFVANGPAPSTDRRHYKKRPSIFLPRAYSRITLEITDIRAQRLQEISEEDARAEGWTSNPWVWAITFKRIGN
jgi:hypothetical protein